VDDKRQKSGSVQFARASELARHFEHLSAAATSTTAHKSSVISRSTSAPLNKPTTTTTSRAVTTASTSRAGTTTTSHTPDMKNKHNDRVGRPETQSSVRPAQQGKSALSGTAVTPTSVPGTSVPGGRGLQFVQNTKSVVLLAQTGSRQVSVDTARTKQNSKNGKIETDRDIKERADNVDDELQRVSGTNDTRTSSSESALRRSTSADAGGGTVGQVSTAEQLEVEREADNKSSTDGVDDLLSRVRANLRSNSVRPVSTSRRFTGAKHTTRQ